MGKHSIRAWAILSLLLSAAHAAGQNLVVNGSFETPYIGDGGGAGFVTFGVGWPITFDPWVVDSGTMDVVSSAGMFGWQQIDGQQSLDLTGSPDAGAIYQDVPTSPGQVYRLRFAMAGNPVANIPPLKEMDLYWGPVLAAHPTFDVTGRTVENLGWTYVQYFVTADAELTRLRFVSRTADAGGIVIDDVSLVAVPEPATAILLLAAGFLHARPRRRSA